MTDSARNSVLDSSHEIVVQDAVSLLNLGRRPGDKSELETIQIRHQVKTYQDIGSVFDVCRKKAPEYLCTFNKTKRVYAVQHVFKCSTCSFEAANNGVCTVCANACHKGHRLKYNGCRKFFCDCGAEKGESGCVALTGKGEKNSLLCTFKETGFGRSVQHFFTCNTCDLVLKEDGHYGMCLACVNICHVGHDVRYAKVGASFFCDCGASGNCKALTL